MTLDPLRVGCRLWYSDRLYLLLLLSTGLFVLSRMLKVVELTVVDLTGDERKTRKSAKRKMQMEKVKKGDLAQMPAVLGIPSFAQVYFLALATQRILLSVLQGSRCRLLLPQGAQ